MQEMTLEKKTKIKGIKQKESAIRNRLKKQKEKQIFDAGKLLSDMGILSLEKDALIGSFLEIKTKYTDPTNIALWKQNAANFTSKKIKEHKIPLAIRFENETSKEVKVLLKSLKFQWNRFRKEWYGTGSVENLAIVLQEARPIFEVLE